MSETRVAADLSRPVFDYVQAFYDQRPGSEESGEVDFGMHWVSGSPLDRVGRRWRVTFVEDTGDVIAVRLAYPATTVWLARGVTREQVERALAGWADDHSPSLKWAVHRLGYANPARQIPRFETSVSPLTTSNDGRVRMQEVSDESSSRTKVISVDGIEEWSTHSQIVVDAFIAGWDARHAADKVEHEEASL